MEMIELVKNQMQLIQWVGRPPRPTDIARWERAAIAALGNLSCALVTAQEKGGDPRRIAPILRQLSEWREVATRLKGFGRPRALKMLES